MFKISAMAPSFGLDAQLVNSPSLGKDKVFIDDPHVDKVTLSDAQPDPDMTYQHLVKISNTTAQSKDGEPGDHNSTAKQDNADSDRLQKLMQQVLDAKTGIDRKKLEEIEEKIDALLAKEGELTEAEKAQLELLQKQKEQLIKEGSKKLAEVES